MAKKRLVKESRKLNEQVSDEAYEVAELVKAEIENAGKIISRDLFDECFENAMMEVFGLDDIDDLYNDDYKAPNGEYMGDFETDVRGILTYDGFETIYEGDDEGGLINPNASLELTDEEIIYRALNYFYNYGYNEYENDGTNTEEVLPILLDNYSEYWDSDKMEKFGITESVDKKSRKNLKEAKSGLYLDVDAYKDETTQHLKDFADAYKKVVDDFAVGVECDDGIPCDANEFIGTKKAMDLFDNSFAEKSFDELRISDWCDEVIDNIKKWTPGTPLKESKQLTETFKGEDIINDLIDRAKSWIDDGYTDPSEAVHHAIDDGLIYGRDIIDLAEHYGVIDDGELIERFYDDLFNDMYSEVSDYAEEHADDERKSNATREYEIAISDITDSLADEANLYDEDGDIDYSVLDDAIWYYLKDELEDGSDLDNFDYDIDGDVIKVFDITYDFDESFQKNKRHTLKENKKKAQRKAIKENKKQAAKKPLTESKKSTNKALKENKKSTKKSLKESVTITMDEEDFLDLLMDRVAFWTKTRYCPEYDLFEKYYEDAVYNGVFDGMDEGIKYIVDNDYVNNGRIVYPDDYDYAEIKAKYEDGSLEDEGVVYTVEENGETYFLII